MTKRRLFIFFAAVLLIFFAVFTFPFQVGSVRGERLLQTWPSRTPTPQGGPQPTATNQGPPPTTDPGGGPNPTAQPGATNTPVTDEAPPLTPSATVVLATPKADMLLLPSRVVFCQRFRPGGWLMYARGRDLIMSRLTLLFI
jgi:hypothetical protein